MFELERMSPRTRIALAAVIRRSHEWLTRVAAIGPQDDRGQRFGAFGEGTCIAFPPGTHFGEHWIHLGTSTLIGPNVTLSAGMVPGQDLGPSPVVVIGDRCNIGRGSHIVAHERVEIGDDVTTGPNVYITDQNHVYADLDVPISRQWPTTDPVHIGPGSWLGAGAVVLPGARLGRNVVVGANSVVRGVVPDHAVVAGVPAKVVRRHSPAGWDPPLRTEPTAPPPEWPR